MRIFFAWYDLWIGVYYDRKARALYICPLPMVVIQIGGQPQQVTQGKHYEVCPECGAWEYRNDIGHKEGCTRA